MEKDLIKKLNTLKDELKPSSQWKKETRDFLFSEISKMEESSKTQGNQAFVLASKNNLFSVIHQPAWVVFFVILTVVGGGFVSAQNTHRIKPGDSLYTARLINEKAQLAMTFNKEKKARLNIEFSNNHVREITEVMSNPDFNNEKNQTKTAKLTQNFKQELNTIKEKIEELNKIKEEETGTFSLGGMKKEDEKFYSADSEKEDKGMDFYTPNNNKNEAEKSEPIKEDVNQEPQPEPKLEENNQEIVNINEEEATSTEEDLFKKAEETFDAGDFAGTKDILEEMDSIIRNIDNPSDETENANEKEILEEKGTSTDSL